MEVTPWVRGWPALLNSLMVTRVVPLRVEGLPLAIQMLPVPSMAR